jgi:putative glutamine amidotransferase
MRPIIGITSDFDLDSRPERQEQTSLPAAYGDAIFAAGGLPLLLPVPASHDEQLRGELLARVHGVVFTGGRDVHPRHYGEPLHAKTRPLHERREAFELALFRQADMARIPIFAICLGSQVACVARGGKLIQHVDDLSLKPPVVHGLPQGRSAFHTVRITPDSRLAAIVGGTEIRVNSRHHQAARADHPGRGLRPVAFSPDGLLEAAEDMGGRFLLSVQWHPENLIDRPQHLALFQALIQAAAGHAPAAPY